MPGEDEPSQPPRFDRAALLLQVAFLVDGRGRRGRAGTRRRRNKGMSAPRQNRSAFGQHASDRSGDGRHRAHTPAPTARPPRCVAEMADSTAEKFAVCRRARHHVDSECAAGANARRHGRRIRDGDGAAAAQSARESWGCVAIVKRWRMGRHALMPTEQARMPPSRKCSTIQSTRPSHGESTWKSTRASSRPRS